MLLTSMLPHLYSCLCSLCDSHDFHCKIQQRLISKYYSVVISTEHAIESIKCEFTAQTAMRLREQDKRRKFRICRQRERSTFSYYSTEIRSRKKEKTETISIRFLLIISVLVFAHYSRFRRVAIRIGRSGRHCRKFIKNAYLCNNVP